MRRSCCDRFGVACAVALGEGVGDGVPGAAVARTVLPVTAVRPDGPHCRLGRIGRAADPALGFAGVAEDPRDEHGPLAADAAAAAVRGPLHRRGVDPPGERATDQPNRCCSLSGERERVDARTAVGEPRHDAPRGPVDGIRVEVGRDALDAPARHPRVTGGQRRRLMIEGGALITHMVLKSLAKRLDLTDAETRQIIAQAIARLEEDGFPA